MAQSVCVCVYRVVDKLGMAQSVCVYVCLAQASMVPSSLLPHTYSFWQAPRRLLNGSARGELCWPHAVYLDLSGVGLTLLEQLCLAHKP
jgi:hypothetical protein